jgi:thiol-disulfide isomerase/thioredoxin
MPLARREFLAAAGIAAAAAAGGAIFAFSRLQSARAAGRLLAEPFTDLHGRTVRLAEWAAPVLLCNFWATWCEPCRVEVPLLIEARRQHAGIGLEIAGIGIDDAVKLQSFTKSFEIDYPVLVGGVAASDLLPELGDSAAALPYSIVLDRERRITGRKLGKWTRPELEREIRRAIG